MNWTSEQKQAIYTDGNVLVSASAGSGKTAVLTERVVRLLESDVNVKIGDLLVATFTNAAAAEMKQRIEKRLKSRADEIEDIRIKNHLNEQAQEVFRANISTLDSFCTKLLRKHFYELSVSPSFRVADDSEIAILKDEVSTELLEFAYAEHSDIIKGLLKFFEYGESSGNVKYLSSEAKLLSVIDKIYDAMRQVPDGKRWLLNSVKAYRPTDDIYSTNTVKSIFEDIQRNARIARGAYKYILQIMEDELGPYNMMPDKQRTLYSDVSGRAAAYDRLTQIEACDISCEYQSFSDIIGKSLMIATPLKEYPDLKEKITKIHNDIPKKARDKIRDAYNLIESIASEQDPELYKKMCDLGWLVWKYNEMFRDKKASRSIVDFGDVELIAYRGLTRHGLDRIYKDKFKYVLVDEYQDISRIQNEIIRAVSRDNNVFFVGDMKQAIYRFRNAEPKLFWERAELYKSKPELGTAIELAKNFRSSKAVLDFTNDICGALFSVDTSEVDYDEKSMLVPRDDAPDGFIEMCILDSEISDNENSADDEVDSLLNSEAEALFAVQKIRELISKRGYKYSDFAILMRSVEGAAEIYTRVFVTAGIPINSEERDGYFDALEVKIFINLLSLIDNRRQDIPLLSVMRTPIGGFSVEEIARLRCDYDAACGLSAKKHERGIYDCLKYSADREGELSDKSRRFLNLLSEYHEESLLVPVEDLIVDLLDKTGFKRFVSALPNGNQRVLNLYGITEKAHAFEQGIGSGLTGFLKYLHDIEYLSSAAPVKNVIPNAVKFMTMHKSKGLEYNVVIIPELEKEIISIKPSKNDVLTDADNGIGIKYADNTRIKRKSPIFEGLLCKETIRTVADELRLLYVALTRARDGIVLISRPKSLSDSLKNADIYSRLGRDAIYRVSTRIELLFFALMHTKHCDAVLNFESSAVSGALSINRVSVTLPEDHRAVNIDDYSALKREVMDIDISDDEFKPWEYPYASEVNLPSKTSPASHDDEVYIAKRGNAQNKEKNEATERGNAMHRFMSLVSIGDHDTDSLEFELRELVNSGLMSAREASLVDCKKICAFFASNIGKRLVSAERIMREKEFTCLIPARLMTDTDSEEKILLDGIIDCCFLENGKWVIVDYKTDSLKEYKTSEEIEKYARETHGKQVKLYAHALAASGEYNISDCYVYMFNYGEVQIV